MAKNPPEGTQRIIPYLYYEDAMEALAILHDAFGFSERLRVPAPAGGIMHAEIGFEGNIVMLAGPLRDEHGDVRDLETSGSSVMCYVDDVDAHHAHALEAGANMTRAPEDQPYGDRLYAAVDPGGHQWFFATHIRDVPPEHPSQT